MLSDGFQLSEEVWSRIERLINRCFDIEDPPQAAQQPMCPDVFVANRKWKFYRTRRT